MPLKPFQEELMSGKHTGLGTPPEKVPNDKEWNIWVQNATQGLSQFKLTIGKSLTDPALVGAALARYNLATQTHTTNDPLSARWRHRLRHAEQRHSQRQNGQHRNGTRQWRDRDGQCQ